MAPKRNKYEVAQSLLKNSNKNNCHFFNIDVIINKMIILMKVSYFIFLSTNDSDMMTAPVNKST